MNKQEFLKAICGKTVKVNIDGLDLGIRSLTTMETQELQGKKEIDTALEMIVLCLTEPKLDKENIEELKLAQPGFISKLAKEISKLSGLDQSDESPTVGNG